MAYDGRRRLVALVGLLDGSALVLLQPAIKAGAIVDWLRQDYDLGRGHAMALVHVIKKGPQIDAKHVDSGGTHRDQSDMLWLDDKATNPG